jgi:hypothetical protein
MTHLCNCNPCRCNSRDAERAAPVCQRTAEVSEPPLGSHLITPRRGYTHHGIYAGDGTVVHYIGLSRFIFRGPVVQVHLTEFASGKPVHVECRSERALDEQEIVARARSRLGENRYRLFTNNCEHFSEWSRFGVSRSKQVERWLGLPTFVLRGLASIVRRDSSASRSIENIERVAAWRSAERFTNK